MTHNHREEDPYVVYQFAHSELAAELVQAAGLC
jgi:hypothetical protein